MDSLKAATDLANKLQSGEEPISGEQGKGTASQPYDQGNAEGKDVLLYQSAISLSKHSYGS